MGKNKKVLISFRGKSTDPFDTPAPYKKVEPFKLAITYRVSQKTPKALSTKLNARVHERLTYHVIINALTLSITINYDSCVNLSCIRGVSLANARAFKFKQYVISMLLGFLRHPVLYTPFMVRDACPTCKFTSREFHCFHCCVWPTG